VIVVVGIPAWQPGPDDPAQGRAAGLAVEIARAAVAAGARVELVGKVGEDRSADLVMLDLSRAGIGHVAMLRDAGGPTRTLPTAEGAVPPAAPARGGEDNGRPREHVT
jgi:sugar/nucleoside kinase (ribokinase family)